MGQSTDGQISFGIALEEDTVFPWDEEDCHEVGVEDWWMKVNGFVNPADYKDDSSQYFANKLEWLKANPMPVELVTHCHCEYPMYILAVPGTHIWNSRGCPKAFHSEELYVSPQQIKILLDFCKQYEIEYEGKPHWYLTSMWG